MNFLHVSRKLFLSGTVVMLYMLCDVYVAVQYAVTVLHFSGSSVS